MMNFLAIEWMKIRKYRTFWILAALFAVLLPLWLYGFSSGFINPVSGKKGATFNPFDTGYKFPEVWASVCYWASWMILFVSVLVIIITTNEFMYRTNRQNVLDGWTRMQFYHAKVGMVVVLSFAATAYIFLLGVIFGRLYTGSFAGMNHHLREVAYFFVLSLDYLGFGLFIAIWIKRSGLAIGLFLLYSMFIETIVKSTINHYADKPWGNLMMLQSSDELRPFPLPPLARMVTGAKPPALSIELYLAVAIAWCVIYYIGGRLLLLRKDW